MVTSNLSLSLNLNQTNIELGEIDNPVQVTDVIDCQKKKKKQMLLFSAQQGEGEANMEEYFFFIIEMMNKES